MVHILTIISLHSIGTRVLRWAGWAIVTYGRVGKLKTRVCKKIAPNFIKPMFAHPGLKPCKLPCAHPSICPSATLRYDFHIRWNTSKVIARPSSLKYLFTVKMYINYSLCYTYKLQPLIFLSTQYQ